MDRDRAGRFNRAQAVKLGVPFGEVVRMTPAQIQNVVFYPREKNKDQLAVPSPVTPPVHPQPSRARDKRVLAGLRVFMTTAKYEAGLAEIDRFWDGKEAREKESSSADA